MKNNNVVIENTMAKKKVAIYMRVGNNDNNQLELQETIVRDYCTKKGYEVSLCYSDINVSASDIKSNLEQLLNDIQYEDINIIVVRDLSRLSRNLFDLFDYINYADEQCHCVIETVNVGTDYKFNISLVKGVLEYE